MSTLATAYEKILRGVSACTHVAAALGECAWTLRTDNTFQPSSGTR